MNYQLALLILLLTVPAFALKTAYVSFDQPEKWQCELSQGVWICQSNLELDRKESVVLSIATLATEWDTLDNYEEYLKKPRTIQDEAGNTLTADVKYVRKRNINGFQWVDSLQFNSELPGFWSRYLSTVQNKYAILITYIVSDDHYKQLAPQFERMVSSLKPNKELDLNIASRQEGGPLPGATILGPKREEFLRGLLNTRKKTAEPEAPPSGNSTTLLVLVGAGAVGTLLFLRKRRKKGQASPKKKPPTEPTPPTARSA